MELKFLILVLIVVVASIGGYIYIANPSINDNDSKSGMTTSPPVIVFEADQTIASNADVQLLFNQYNDTIWDNTQTAHGFPFNVYWVYPGFQHINVQAITPLEFPVRFNQDSHRNVIVNWVVQVPVGTTGAQFRVNNGIFEYGKTSFVYPDTGAECPTQIVNGTRVPPSVCVSSIVWMPSAVAYYGISADGEVVLADSRTLGLGPECPPGAAC